MYSSNRFLIVYALHYINKGYASCKYSDTCIVEFKICTTLKWFLCKFNNKWNNLIKGYFPKPFSFTLCAKITRRLVKALQKGKESAEQEVILLEIRYFSSNFTSKDVFFWGYISVTISSINALAGGDGRVRWWWSKWKSSFWYHIRTKGD